MKTSWMKLKRVRRMITINFQFVLFCFHRFIILNSFWRWKMKKYHLRIVFESCHKMFLNTSNFSDNFYHWTNFAHTKHSEEKKERKREKKFVFLHFCLVKWQKNNPIIHEKGLPTPARKHKKAIFRLNFCSIFVLFIPPLKKWKIFELMSFLQSFSVIWTDCQIPLATV